MNDLIRVLRRWLTRAGDRAGLTERDLRQNRDYAELSPLLRAWGSADRRPAPVAPIEHVGADASWSPKTTWNSVDATDPEETAEEHADRVAREIQDARQREDERLFAELGRQVHAEFEARFVAAGIDQQIKRVGEAADATLAAMRKKWKLTAADMRRVAEARPAKVRAERFIRRLRKLASTSDATATHEQWAAAILSPTGPLPIVKRGETAGVR